MFADKSTARMSCIPRSLKKGIKQPVPLPTSMILLSGPKSGTASTIRASLCRHNDTSCREEYLFSDHSLGECGKAGTRLLNFLRQGSCEDFGLPVEDVGLPLVVRLLVPRRLSAVSHRVCTPPHPGFWPSASYCLWPYSTLLSQPIVLIATVFYLPKI